MTALMRMRPRGKARLRLRAALSGAVFAAAGFGSAVDVGFGSAPSSSAVIGRSVLGRSVLGRPIRLIRAGNPRAGHRVLVVGCIHGNECAGVSIARWLERHEPPPNTLLWVIENANPDGFAAGRRQNAHGVDLNRNFPWRWRTLGRPGDLHYAGTHPLSEPESRLLSRLIVRIRPELTIWFHQPLAVVDDSGGRRLVARRYARLVGLPFVRLPRYPGSAAGWQNHLYPNTSFVVELPAGPLTSAAAARFGDGILDLLALV